MTNVGGFSCVWFATVSKIMRFSAHKIAQIYVILDNKSHPRMHHSTSTYVFFFISYHLMRESPFFAPLMPSALILIRKEGAEGLGEVEDGVKRRVGCGGGAWRSMG